MAIKRINYKELKNQYLPLDLNINTTDELAKLDVIIDQENAKNAMEFGLSIKSSGYNIYVSGDSTKSCEIFSEKMINQNSPKEIKMKDWCYVYNFKQPEAPQAICFGAGGGVKFKDDIDELVFFMQNELAYMAEDDDIDHDIAIKKIGYYIKKLKEVYNENTKVKEHLDYLQEDIINNIENVVEGSITGYTAAMYRKYSVNLVINNSQVETLPVVVADVINYNDLIGEIKYYNSQGTFVSNHMDIRPGLLHKANGGYIIIDVIDLLEDKELWKQLKNIIKSNEVSIENPNCGNVMSIIKLSPQPIPLDIKIILVGSQDLYYYLYSKDIEFKDLFKVHCILTKDIENSRENTILLAHLMKNIIDSENLQAFTMKAVEKAIESVIRYGGDRNKLRTNFEYITDILKQSNYVATSQGDLLVEDFHVELALAQKDKRINDYQTKATDLINDDIVMINTKGYETGQINALAISTIGECSFGIPIRVTCTTYRGDTGVISAEREAGQSGSISNKSLEIMEGYLGGEFCQDTPLNFTARLCYEQNYQKVNGDSASSAQLYSVISSLAGVPIDQGLAVTGSVDQYGNIQPVSKIARKVEGFFDICRNKGFTGKQGVIIPKQNEKNLTLNPEVIKEIKEENFHIYTIATINDGLKLLMKENPRTIFDKVDSKLKRFDKVRQY